MMLKFSYNDALSLSFQSILATAGYGTALGVIRALHSSEVLEKAFCTETRPFNQVHITYSIRCIIMGIQIVSFILFWGPRLGFN
jgi:hypothetical protein